jgi:predicted acetyltransferase
VSEIRILAEGEFAAFCDILADAFPGWKISSPEEKERVRQRLFQIHKEEPTATMYGLFREGELQGGMRFHDFSMNLFGNMVAAGGVGLIAVDLLHKKEHVAKEMVEFFLRHYRQRGAPLTLLYPFRPDFYRQMGFGYGTKMSQYRVRPSALPKGPSKSHVRLLGEDDLQALVDCYHRVMERTHGMMVKSEAESQRIFRNSKNRVAAYEGDGQVQGYMVFSFEHGESAIINDIQVTELIYENPEALQELLTFLHSQADQIRHVFFNTQDADYHHLLLDPRNGVPELIPSVYHQSNVQGVGIMYRVVDCLGALSALQQRDFGGQTLRARFEVEDSFLPENSGSWLLSLEEGRLSVAEEGGVDVDVGLGVAELSSLVVGAVDFRSLYSYGLAEVSDTAFVDVLDRAFASRVRPICTTPF